MRRIFHNGRSVSTSVSARSTQAPALNQLLDARPLGVLVAQRKTSAGTVDHFCQQLWGDRTRVVKPIAERDEIVIFGNRCHGVISYTEVPEHWYQWSKMIASLYENERAEGSKI
jgi:hypothetical protein